MTEEERKHFVFRVKPKEGKNRVIQKGTHTNPKNKCAVMCCIEFRRRQMKTRLLGEKMQKELERKRMTVKIMSGKKMPNPKFLNLKIKIYFSVY